MRLPFTALALCLCGSALYADEGMWLPNRFPAEAVQKAHGFSVSPDFLGRLQRGAVRFNNGGSGSFVSPNGLLFTNHHVGLDCIHKLSTKQNDYVKNGFYAATESDEKACPDLEVNLLALIEDVTAKVNEGVQASTPSSEANQMRKAAMSRLEKECTTSTGNRCDVVTLYSGGEYHLYQYKKFTDVRLVFAPEVEIAFFGGDPDNFTYPRYCLDFAFFRAYENGKPARVQNYFPWSKTAVKEADLVFVSGHPGSTGRLATIAALEFFRDLSFPFVHRRLHSQIRALEEYSAQSDENRRVAKDNLFSASNSYKAYTGFLSGLRDQNLMSRKREEERKLRAAVEDARLGDEYNKAWPAIAGAYKDTVAFYRNWWLLEANATRGAALLEIARTVLRYAEEKTKPNEKRLREFADSALESVEQEMYSPAPITDSMEIVVLTDYFRVLEAELGPNDPAVKAVLDGRKPAEAAAHYVTTSKLKDVAERKRLAASVDAVSSSQDGMIRLARALDGPARAVRKRYEDGLEATLATNAGKIAQARFKILGTNEYPDATFTLRVTYGPVKGYRDGDGKPVPFTTDFAGVFRKATGKDPYVLPPSWLKARPRLKLATPFNFVSTCDIHGGNSGSPTVNTKGEVVGIIFDSNLEGLPNRFVFTDEQARALHVSGTGILEALRTIYNAKRVVTELGGGPR